jgi:hypothetical protein
MAAITKIGMSSNGQNCSILSQKVPKFELYGGHLDRRAEPPDTFLEENHPMSISSTFCSY